MVKKLDKFVCDAISYSRQMNFDERMNFFEKEMKNIIDSDKYKRFDIFESVHRVMNCAKNDDDITIIGEYLTLLVGDCAPNYIIKFPGDPNDLAELVRWVRNNEWKCKAVDKAGKK